MIGRVPRPANPCEIAQIMQTLVDAISRGEIEVDPDVLQRLEERAALVSELARRRR